MDEGLMQGEEWVFLNRLEKYQLITLNKIY